MHVMYVGPYEAVEIPVLNGVVVQRGEQITVDDELGASLSEQDAWQEVTAAGKPVVKRKAGPGDTTGDTGKTDGTGDEGKESD